VKERRKEGFFVFLSLYRILSFYSTLNALLQDLQSPSLCYAVQREWELQTREARISPLESGTLFFIPCSVLRLSLSRSEGRTKIKTVFGTLYHVFLTTTFEINEGRRPIEWVENKFRSSTCISTVTSTPSLHQLTTLNWKKRESESTYHSGKHDQTSPLRSQFQHFLLSRLIGTVQRLFQLLVEFVQSRHCCQED